MFVTSPLLWQQWWRLFVSCLLLCYCLLRRADDDANECLWQVREVELLLYTAARCSVVYPDPSDVTERHVTMATFICQYMLPMLVTSLAYGRIACRLWWRGRDVDGLADGGGGGGLLPTERQRVGHDRARRRSVALLASVVIVFSVSWLPLNLYHVLTDFHPDTTTFHYNRFLTLSRAEMSTGYTWPYCRPNLHS